MAVGQWQTHIQQEMEGAIAANRLSAQQLLRKACPVSRNADQVRAIGAAAADSQSRTLIWSGPELLYASAPAFTAPAPLLTGPQRSVPGWTGWAEVDLACGLSVQRFRQTGAAEHAYR